MKPTLSLDREGMFNMDCQRKALYFVNYHEAIFRGSTYA